MYWLNRLERGNTEGSEASAEKVTAGNHGEGKERLRSSRINRILAEGTGFIRDERPALSQVSHRQKEREALG